MKSATGFCLLILFLFLACKKEDPIVFDEDAFHKALTKQINKLETPDSIYNIQAAISQNMYSPIISKENRLLGVQQIQKKLAEMPNHGLADYFIDHYNRLKSTPLQNDSLLMVAIKDSNYQAIAQLEIDSRMAGIAVNRALEFGIVNPNLIYLTKFSAKAKQPDSMWYANQFQMLNFGEYVYHNQPKHTKYAGLQKKYAETDFSALKDSYIPLPSLPKRKLEIGDKYLGAQQLRQRLGLAELPDSSKNQTIYDQELSDEIKRFQKNQGIITDGILGTSTYHLLNISPQQLQEKMQASLERMRWNFSVSFDNLLLVNIPEYKIYVYDEGKQIQEHKVCVGINHERLSTPEFVDTLEKVVVNPKWYLPKSISTLEVLPKAQADPTYLHRNNYKMYAGNQEVDPASVNLLSLSPDFFPYRFVQEVGPGNSLGRIKFLFPNKHSVYLHDTPAKYVFKRDKRSVSHGCIRLQNPFELGDYLLGNNIEYQKAKESDQTKLFYVKEPIYQVFITYYTSWVNHNNQLQYRQDVYNRDEILIEELRKEKVIH